jgi:hypothetical protein
MRHVPVLLLHVASVTSTPNLFADFLLPIPETPPNNTTIVDHDGDALELIKRQTGCATGYNPCSNLGNPGLCCRADSICSADAAGHIACCPIRAACTGTIGGQPNSQPTQTSSDTNNPFQTTTTTQPFGVPTATQTSFVQSGASSYIASTVSNPFYPFPFIPTTYINAAACSSAYTSCQNDASSCSVALASGVAGVTISAPNGGATVTAIASLGPESAASVCASLSATACYGLQVAACQAFGTQVPDTGAANSGRGCGMYGVGVGVVMGVVGGMGLAR